jgi:hypothetical protein
MDQLQRLLGRPKVVAGLLRTPVEEAIVATRNEAIEVAERELVALLPQLIELPEFRLAGAEEAIRQLINLLDQTRTQQESHLAELETIAAATFDQLISYANIQKGMRKPAPAEFEELITHYPTAQHRLVIARGVVRTYRRLRDVLTGQLAAVSNCRQRVEACLPTLKAEADIPAAARAPGEMLPPGCASIEDAAQTFLRSLTDDDLIALDGCVQHGLEQLFGGLYEACLNSTEGTSRLTRLIREEAWVYLNGRLGEVDLSGMFTAHHGSREVAAEALVQAYDGAAPALVGGGPWARSQVCVFACPSGLGGEPLRQLAAGVFPEGVAPAEAHDEVVLYREYPSVPLVAVPQLGPAWSAAYRAAPETQQVSPHARMDVTVWADVDAV